MTTTDAWQHLAACRGHDPELWFPFTGEETQPKRVCAACPVRAACLQYALDTGQRYGVWGGLTEDERRELPRPSTATAAGGGDLDDVVAELMDRGVGTAESAAHLMRPEPEVRRSRDRIRKRRLRREGAR